MIRLERRVGEDEDLKAERRPDGLMEEVRDRGVYISGDRKRKAQKSPEKRSPDIIIIIASHRACDAYIIIVMARCAGASRIIYITSPAHRVALLCYVPGDGAIREGPSLP